MEQSTTYFCWNDGYLSDSEKAECPVCGKSKMTNLMTQMLSIYDWYFPVRLYTLPDNSEFLSCRNAVVCENCGEIQSGKNKTCQACGKEDMVKFELVFNQEPWQIGHGGLTRNDLY